MRKTLLFGAAVAVAVSWGLLHAGDVDPFDQSSVPLEKQPTDPSLKKIVLVAGRMSHGPGDHEFFAGCAILMKLLQQTPGVFPVMVRDGWPKKPETFDNAAAVVFYMDGGNGHPILNGSRKDVVQKLMDKGVGFVNLHYAVEYPKSASDHVFQWLGGYYETGFSTNPHWDADFTSFPEHAVTRGVKPFKIRDEWYFNIRFKPEAKNVTTILQSTPPDAVRRTKAAAEHKGRSETVAWTFERTDGGRSFGFTGGHTHTNWGNEHFRRLVTNAILWTAKVEVPKEGAKVELDPSELKRNLDRKIPRKK